MIEEKPEYISVNFSDPPLSIVRFFGFDISDDIMPDAQRELQYVWQASQDFTKSNDVGTNLLFLRKTLNKLGKPPIGVSSLRHLYQYFRIMRQSQLLEQSSEELKSLQKSLKEELKSMENRK
jgi:hypothetical protein